MKLALVALIALQGTAWADDIMGTWNVTSKPTTFGTCMKDPPNLVYHGWWPRTATS